MTSFANFGQKFFRNKAGEIIGLALGHSYAYSHEHGLSVRLKEMLESDSERCINPEALIQVEKDGIVFWHSSIFTADRGKVTDDVAAYFTDKKKSSWSLDTEPYADRAFETLWDQNSILIRFQTKDNDEVKKFYSRLIEDGMLLQHPDHRIVLCVGDELEQMFV